MASASYQPGGLIAGDYPQMKRNVTLLSGENRSRGAVLGEITVGAATSAAKSGGNTGTGTFTLDGSTPVLAGAKVGVYTVRCTAAASNSGTFRVEDPDGFVLGDVAVGATFSDDIKFVIADGGTDFIVGDGFDVTVAAGSGKYKLSVATATDGSQVPVAVLAEAADATDADMVVPVLTSGQFAADMLTFGSGHTAASVELAWRRAGRPMTIVTRV